MSLAKYSTIEEAEAYNANVQALLEAINVPGEPKKYIGHRWADVTERDGFFYIETHPEIDPETETVSDLPQIEGKE